MSPALTVPKGARQGGAGQLVGRVTGTSCPWTRRYLRSGPLPSRTLDAMKLDCVVATQYLVGITVKLPHWEERAKNELVRRGNG